MNRLQPIHQLECNDYGGLDGEAALFERFLELLQVQTQQLHDQVIIILIRAITVEPRESDPAVLGGGSRLLLLIGL